MAKKRAAARTVERGIVVPLPERAQKHRHEATVTVWTVRGETADEIGRFVLVSSGFGSLPRGETRCMAA